MDLDYDWIPEDKPRAALLKMVQNWHDRLQQLKQLRKEGSTHSKLNGLLIELTQRLTELSRIYVSTDEKLSYQPLVRKNGRRETPGPDQQWLIPKIGVRLRMVMGWCGRCGGKRSEGFLFSYYRKVSP